MSLAVPISWGELIDKITILEIKSQRIQAGEARANIDRELAKLTAIMRENAPADGRLAQLAASLKNINEKLWDIEDRIRDKERQQSFDGEFVALARSVYMTNDQRAQIKRQINLLLNSELIEEKQYRSY